MSWADLSDVRCYYEILGQGAPLLLIPGLGMNCRCWDEVLPELAGHFTLILPDNRGMGFSVTKRQPRTIADLSADLVELLDHLQLDRAHVMGLSFGGAVAQRLAVDHPSRVDRLVLVSCADRFSPYLRQVAFLLRHALRRLQPEMFLRAVDLLGTSPRYLDAHEQLVEQRLRAKCKSITDRNAVAIQLRCLSCLEINPLDDRILAPTLVIAGEDDHLIPSCYARAMAEKIADSRFLLMRGTGHNPLQECPGDVLPRIIQFLNETRDATVASHASTGHGEHPQITELCL